MSVPLRAATLGHDALHNHRPPNAVDVDSPVSTGIDVGELSFSDHEAPPSSSWVGETLQSSRNPCSEIHRRAMGLVECVVPVDVDVEGEVGIIDSIFGVDLVAPRLQTLMFSGHAILVRQIALLVRSSLYSVVGFMALISVVAQINGSFGLWWILSDGSAGHIISFNSPQNLPALLLLLLRKLVKQFFELDLSTELQIFSRIFTKILTVKGREEH